MVGHPHAAPGLGPTSAQSSSAGVDGLPNSCRKQMSHVVAIDNTNYIVAKRAATTPAESSKLGAREADPGVLTSARAVHVACLPDAVNACKVATSRNASGIGIGKSQSLGVVSQSAPCRG
eukprot:6529715-Prymnesium_polylepis.3